MGVACSGVELKFAGNGEVDGGMGGWFVFAGEWCGAGHWVRVMGVDRRDGLMGYGSAGHGLPGLQGMADG